MPYSAHTHSGGVVSGGTLVTESSTKLGNSVSILAVMVSIYARGEQHYTGIDRKKKARKRIIFHVEPHRVHNAKGRQARCVKISPLRGRRNRKFVGMGSIMLSCSQFMRPTFQTSSPSFQSCLTPIHLDGAPDSFSTHRTVLELSRAFDAGTNVPTIIE